MDKTTIISISAALALYSANGSAFAEMTKSGSVAERLSIIEALVEKGDLGLVLVKRSGNEIQYENYHDTITTSGNPFDQHDSGTERKGPGK